MKIAVIGGDRRFDLLAEMLAARHDVLRDPSAVLLRDVDAVVAQDPKRGGKPLAQMLKYLPQRAQLILHGGGAEVPEGVACTDLLVLEDFVRQNAILTAEGAICAAMRATDGALAGSRCMIVGYGRIGKALTKMLLGLGAQAVVAARKPEVRMQAQAAGAEVCDTREKTLAEMIALADFVFSTPPELVLTEPVLRHVRQGVPVIDLASAPFGVDLEAAKTLGVNAWRESGVPGRYCPQSAAKLMAAAVERLLTGPVG